MLAAFFLVHDPAARGSMPYGANAGEIDSLSDFLTVPHFWRVTLSFGLWWFAGAIVYIQIAPFLVEKGFTTASAATSVIVFGAANCLGRIAFGWLSDRIGSVWSYRAAVLSAPPPVRVSRPTTGQP